MAKTVTFNGLKFDINYCKVPGCGRSKSVYLAERELTLFKQQMMNDMSCSVKEGKARRD